MQTIHSFIIEKLAIRFVSCVCTYYPNKITIKSLKRLPSIGIIITLQIQIAASIRRNICLPYTCLLTVFQSAVILKLREKPLQNFTLACPCLTHQHLVTTSNHSRFQFQLKNANLFAYKYYLFHYISMLL